MLKLLKVILLATFIQDGRSLRCYVCDSETLKVCGAHILTLQEEDFTKIPSEECKQVKVATVINETVQDFVGLRQDDLSCLAIKYYANNTVITVKGCWWSYAPNTIAPCTTLKYYIGHYRRLGSLISCNICTKDLCNLSQEGNANCIKWSLNHIITFCAMCLYLR